MRAFLAVFEREVVERRLLALGALVLGLVPLAAPLLPGLGGSGGPEVRNATALALALSFSLGLALILGASVVARDLIERRLGFYFSRPIAGWAIWSGKLAAAFVLALGLGILILLPAAAVDRRLDLGGLFSVRVSFPSLAESMLLWTAAVLFLVFLGHAGSVTLRSRSPWLLLDFVGLGLVAWLAWAAIRRLTFAGAVGAGEVMGGALVALALLVLIAAGAVQVLKGRTDFRRGHRLLSLTLWGALVAGVVVAQGYVSWVLAAEPEDLDEIGLSSVAPRNPWIAIFGPVRHRAGYTPEFLLDTSSGRFARVKFWLPPQFSADGRWAVWLEPQDMLRGTGPYELLRLDLGGSGSQPERTRMTYSGKVPPVLAVSADGRQAAIATGRRLTLEDVPSGRLLASAELPRELEHAEDSLLFVAPGRVRVFGYELFSETYNPMAPGGAFEVGEIEVGGGGFRRAARIEHLVKPELSRDMWWFSRRPQLSADGTHLLARRSDHRLMVFDAGNGAVMTELPAEGERSTAAFLADGRIAVVTGSRSRELRIFSRDFVPERTFHFAGAGLLLGGQPAPHRLVVATSPHRLVMVISPRKTGIMTAPSETLILDLATGSMRRLGTGLVPVVSPQTGPESVGARLFWRDGISRLVHVDLATGRERVIAGRRAG